MAAPQSHHAKRIICCSQKLVVLHCGPYPSLSPTVLVHIGCGSGGSSRNEQQVGATCPSATKR